MRDLVQALIFDFDGVLADTEPLHWRSWAALLASHGLNLTWDEYCRFGRGVKDEHLLANLPQLAGNQSVLAALQPRLTERMDMVRNWCSQEMPILRRNVELIRSLRGIPLGLVTSSERRDVEPLLQSAGIHSCFHAIVYGEETALHKPAPAPYLLMRSRLGIAAGTAFEDSEAGLQSARAAGFHVVRIGSPAELADRVEEIRGSARFGSPSGS